MNEKNLARAAEINRHLGELNRVEAAIFRNDQYIDWDWVKKNLPRFYKAYRAMIRLAIRKQRKAFEKEIKGL